MLSDILMGKDIAHCIQESLKPSYYIPKIVQKVGL